MALDVGNVAKSLVTRERDGEAAIESLLTFIDFFFVYWYTC